MNLRDSLKRRRLKANLSCSMYYYQRTAKIIVYIDRGSVYNILAYDVRNDSLG